MFVDENSMGWSTQNRKTMAKRMKRAGYRKVPIRVLPWQKPTVFWARLEWSVDQITAVIAQTFGKPIYSGPL